VEFECIIQDEFAHDSICRPFGLDPRIFILEIDLRKKCMLQAFSDRLVTRRDKPNINSKYATRVRVYAGGEMRSADRQSVGVVDHENIEFSVVNLCARQWSISNSWVISDRAKRQQCSVATLPRRLPVNRGNIVYETLYESPAR